jgi:aryl carrier-like protein
MIKIEMLDSIRYMQKQERIKLIKFGIDSVRSTEKKQKLKEELKKLTQ